MPISLSLDEMSAKEKVAAMEALWDDLCAHAEAVQSPQWHGDLLTGREADIAEGKEAFSDWEAAKKRIRDQFK